MAAGRIRRALGRAARRALRRPRRALGRLARAAARLALILAGAGLLWVAAYRVVDPPGGLYMLTEAWRLGGVRRDWRGLDRISPDMARAAAAAEDARFCDHPGIDVEALMQTFRDRAAGSRRGGSTITQQVAKNLFLWHGRSWLRKGLEAGFALSAELLWPKRRIMEIYLNVAEFDEGVFGVEAAAQAYFGRSAAELTLSQAARLAAILPDPKGRDARADTAYMRRRAAAIVEGARTLEAEGRDACFAPG